MDAMESQIIRLIHKVDTLDRRIEQLNRKMTVILSRGDDTKASEVLEKAQIKWSPSGVEGSLTLNQNVKLPQLDVRISDYYAPEEILDANLSGQNVDRNGQVLDSDAIEPDISPPTTISTQYLLDDEDCYPTGETKERRSPIHQDILVTEDYLEDIVECDPPEITEDIQIRRLTAQLTAAYNRIAALEEQLVSKRMHV